jgi:hypothetical protein
VFHAQEELVNNELDPEQELYQQDTAKSKEEKAIALSIAYHNLAVELEFTGKGDASLQVMDGRTNCEYRS